MKTHSPKSGSTLNGYIVTLAVGLALCGCGRNSASTINSQAARLDRAIDPLAIVLAPHTGDKCIDADIRELQARVRAGGNADAAIERLGWLFVAKARESFDEGFYIFAERCALALESRNASSSEALLLRGHVLQSEHRFQEAEALARELVKQRGLSFDYGLLGDILADVGRVDEAAEAYQRMLDLKPDPQGYARAAHIRWLKGDVAGAVELMRMAARGVSPRDAESGAWMHSQLARYLWQSQANDEAARALGIALEFQSGYAPALLLRGRMLLAAGRTDDAIQSLRPAAKANPLPEYQWVLAEALRAGGREQEARAVENEIVRRGAGSDPRSCSLYLATRRESIETAVQLAREELKDRGDIFTHAALAWALAAAGRFDEAQTNMSRALAHGTQDARLFFHATVIAAKTGKFDEASEWLAKARALTPLLLPSEVAQLESAASLISTSASPNTVVGRARRSARAAAPTWITRAENGAERRALPWRI